MSKTGGVALAVAAVALFAVPVEAFQGGGGRPGSGHQLRTHQARSQAFHQPRRAGREGGFGRHREHRGSGPRHDFRQHHGFRDKPHFRDHHGGRHHGRFDHHHGFKRHHPGFKFFFAPPTVFLPPVLLYRPAPVYVPPPAAYYWYYCQDPPGYYPYVAACLTDWIPVVPH
jgi:hypothetical protein